MLKLRVLGVVAIASLLAACSSGVQSVPTGPNTTAPASAGGLTILSTFTARDEETGTVVHIYPTRDVIDQINQGRQLERRRSSNLGYHGGPVQTAPKLYVVFWGSSWTSSGDPQGVVMSRLLSFYGVIGGSKWLNSVTQYTQSGGAHVGNTGNILAGSYVDTSSTPPLHPSQAQMAAEAASAAAHFVNSASASASYVVAMPHGISPSGFGTQYCAYHSTTTSSGSTIAWTNLPYMPDAGVSCGANSVNSPGTLDGVTIVGGHEQGETETDPQLNAWYDSSGAENGDKCAWINLENNLNAGNYPTQPLWSNASSSCVQSF
jgi:hypothetical protein